MKLKSVFLGENGLTTTSAQHIKDMAGHYVDNLRQKLNSITFVNTNISIIGSDKQTLINRGWNLDELNSINEILIRIAKAQSLQAWLGEAINAKNNLQRDIEDYDIKDFVKEHNIEVPEVKSLPRHIEECEWLDTLSIKDRNRYLTLQTLCAVIGSFIHTKTGFDKNYHSAREDALKYDKSPFVVNENGQDTIIRNYILSIPLEDIDKKYFELQAIHRQYQAEFNALKHQFEIYRNDKFVKDKQEYNESLNKHNQFMNELMSQMKDEVENLKVECAKLKIVIPDALNDIYTEINNLGK